MTLEQIYQAYFQYQEIMSTYTHSQCIMAFQNINTSDDIHAPMTAMLHNTAKFGLLGNHKPKFRNKASSIAAHEIFHTDAFDASDAYSNSFVSLFSDNAKSNAALIATLRDQPVDTEWKFYGFCVDCQMFYPVSLMFIRKNESIFESYGSNDNKESVSIGSNNFQALVEFGKNRVYIVESSEVKHLNNSVIITVTEIINRQKTRRFQTILDEDRQIDEKQSAWQITLYAPAE